MWMNFEFHQTSLSLPAGHEGICWKDYDEKFNLQDHT